MKNLSRSKTWKKIWGKKGQGKYKKIHYLNGFNYLLELQYSSICKILLSPLNIKKDDKVIECGCGAGAFLLNLKKNFNVTDITGVD